MPITDNMQNVNLLGFVYQFSDLDNHVKVPTVSQAGQLSEVLKQLNFEQSKYPGNELVFGASKINHWVRFCLQNSTKKIQSLVLTASPAVLLEIDFYPQKEGAKAFQTGNGLPMNTRDIFSPEFHFNIELQTNEAQEFYLRLKSRTNAYLIASIWDKQQYLVAKDKIEGIDGILAGILIGLILYTMLLYFSVRQSSSLLYIVWSASTLILLASIDGRVLQYFLPNNPVLAYGSTLIFYPITLILSALFAQQFIRLKEYNRLYRGGQLVILLFVLSLLVAFNISYAHYFKVCALFALIIVVYFGLISPFYGLFVHRSEQAKYLLIAQFPLIICVLDRALFAMGFTSEHYIPYTAKVGLVAEMILLAYCIGLNIYTEKNQAQQQALEQLTLSNELKTNYNKELEREITRNTAEINEMNLDLEQQAKQLIEIDQAKSKFFANISHEFRTPLTLIQGPLSRLLEEGVNTSNAPQVIEDSIRHSKSLQELIDQLLTLSKFDAKSLQLRVENTNISQVVREISTQFSSVAENKNIELVFQTTDPALKVYVDHDKLRTILNNLLSNALKFTDQGGRIEVKISATVSADKDISDYAADEYLQIQVADTGHGIPNDELKLVFDRYYQSDSSIDAGSGRGTGIGLALVKELIELHAGQVTVNSVHQATLNNNSSDQESSGTTFHIYLPLGKAHFRANEIIDSSNQNIETTQTLYNSNELITNQYADNDISEVQEASLNSNVDEPQQHQESLSQLNSEATLLVVDDNDDMRSYIVSVLEPYYSIVQATDGLHAQSVLKKTSADLVITDLMMPNRDGLQLVKSLKADPELAQIPVIMLTAKAGLEHRLDGLLAAVDDYLTKPFDARELLLCTNNLLNKQAQFQAFYGSKLKQSLSTNAVIESNSDNSANKSLRLKDAEQAYALISGSIDIDKKGHTLNNQNFEGDQESDFADEYLNKLKSVIDANLSDSSFGVNELAKEMHLSKATLGRQLKLKFSFTPSQFIRQCRLERARQLSLEGKCKTIAELANVVGFNQPGYFSKLYQKAFNSMPLEK